MPDPKVEEVVVEPEIKIEESTQIGDDQPQKEDTKDAEVETTEPSEDEVIASEAGWKPKDQWEGDPKKWVPAEEFNRRGELFSKIDSMGKDLRDTKKALRMLQEHHGKVKETEYNRALAQVRALKKQALTDGDADAVVQADDQLMDLRAAKAAEEHNSRQQIAQPDPRFISWVEKNSWYAQDSEMRTFADDIGIAHAKAHPEKPADEVLKYVEQRIKRTYPEKFTNPNRTRPNAVVGREAQGVNKTAKDDFALTEDERKIMNTFVSEGVMTKEQYIADLKAIKGA